jgi:hypothetical protein
LRGVYILRLGGAAGNPVYLNFRPGWLVPRGERRLVVGMFPPAILLFLQRHTIQLLAMVAMAACALPRDRPSPPLPIIGDRLLRDYTEYDPLPITASAAVAQGWVANPKGPNHDPGCRGCPPPPPPCTPGLGVRYIHPDHSFFGGKNTMSTSAPIVLYFVDAQQCSTAAVQQLSAIGVLVVGEKSAASPIAKLNRSGFYQPWPGPPTHQLIAASDELYFISIALRSAEHCCPVFDKPDCPVSTKQPLGDRLVLNSGLTPSKNCPCVGPCAPGINYSLPTAKAAAIAAGWVAGSCFSGMGKHYFKQLGDSTAPPPQLGTLSFPMKAEKLLPVALMFDEEGEAPTGLINAIFFTATDRQQSRFPKDSNQWDPAPQPVTSMCKNFCDKNCAFTDTSLFSTLHLFFRDYSRVTCDNDCHIGCCSNSSYVCMEAMQTACGDLRHHGAACFSCLGTNQRVLQRANCTNANFNQFCSVPLPTPPPRASCIPPPPPPAAKCTAPGHCFTISGAKNPNNTKILPSGFHINGEYVNTPSSGIHTWRQSGFCQEDQSCYERSKPCCLVLYRNPHESVWAVGIFADNAAAVIKSPDVGCSVSPGGVGCEGKWLNANAYLGPRTFGYQLNPGLTVAATFVNK